MAAAEVAALVTTNLSKADQEELAAALPGTADALIRSNLPGHGHVQGTDLVLNYLTARASRDGGATLLLASHGMGFMPAATLLRLSGGPA